jgi:hypothetical protein
MQSKIRILSILNLLALLVHISFSYATQFKLINKKTVGEVSDQYTSLFTPAGFTFAIWSLIYLSLIAFCIYHIIMAYRQVPVYYPNQDISRMGGLFMFNNLAAAGWLLAWTQEKTGLSLILILFQLFSLIMIHLLTDIYNPRRSFASKLLTQFPLSIYLGWISIATIANTAIFLSSINWNGAGLGFSAITWTRVMIAVAVFITLVVVLLRSNVFFGLVVIWALYGIIGKLQTVNTPGYNEIIQTAWIAIAVVGVVCVIQGIKNAGRSKVKNPFPEAVSIK